MSMSIDLSLQVAYFVLTYMFEFIVPWLPTRPMPRSYWREWTEMLRRRCLSEPTAHCYGHTHKGLKTLNELPVGSNCLCGWLCCRASTWQKLCRIVSSPTNSTVTNLNRMIRRVKSFMKFQSFWRPPLELDWTGSDWDYNCYNACAFLLVFYEA